MKIKINNVFYIHFNDFTLTSPLDSVASSFSFTVRYDPKNKEHRELFRPLAFHGVEFYNDKGQVFFTGTIVSHNFNSKESPDLVQLSGYSLPGILEDCTIPYSAYPLESLSSSLKEITEKILKNFGLVLRIDSSVAKEVNTPYKKSTAKPEGVVKDYLAKLAAQRNIILSHDIHGRLVYFRPDPDAKAIRFYNKENTTRMGLDISGQGMHSELTILRQQPGKDKSNVSASDTIKNQLVKKYRPSVQLMTSGEETDTKAAVENYLADELKNIKLDIDINRWDGMMTGDIIEVQNDEIFIHKKTRFMVASTTISENSDGRTMSISAVLPESFIGKTPKNIFDDIN